MGKEELKNLLTLLSEFCVEAGNKPEFGTWVQSAQDKNEDIKLLTVTDLRNWLTRKTGTSA